MLGARHSQLPPAVTDRFDGSEVPDHSIETLDMSGAPPDWQRRARWCHEQGADWTLRGTTLGLLVPSAVLGSAVPDRNIVLNVAHPTFADLLPLRALDVWLDERVGSPQQAQ